MQHSFILLQGAKIMTQRALRVGDLLDTPLDKRRIRGALGAASPLDTKGAPKKKKKEKKGKEKEEKRGKERKKRKKKINQRDE